MRKTKQKRMVIVTKEWCKFFFVVANNRNRFLYSEIKTDHIKIDQDKLVYFLLSQLACDIRRESQLQRKD